MRRLLIADLSEESARVLAGLFQKEYEVSICCDGRALVDTLRSFRPELLILDLMMPVLDGFEAMRRAQDVLPPVILATTPVQNEYVIHCAMKLGVGHILMRPCTHRAIREHLCKMLWLAEHPDCRFVTPQMVALRHLQTLGFVPGREGFQQLRVGIPLLAQDPAMVLGKELYPAICQLMESGTPRTVEHNIRSQIKLAWMHRDAALWLCYFPQCIDKAPTNGEFLSRLAQLVEEEISKQVQFRPLEPVK